MSDELARQRYLADKVTPPRRPNSSSCSTTGWPSTSRRAIAAQADGDLASAAAPLLHAQQIVTELHASLDTVRVERRRGPGRAVSVRICYGLMAARSTPNPEALRGLATIVGDLRLGLAAGRRPRSRLDGPAVARVG